ncbi:MAG TPA: threonine synthase [Firmicutes bacterium]|jgi:threonine synthase|nr:threonine synthase [Bacillota bacterium]
MNYVSTRGSVANLKASEAIRMGLAPDGGLLTAETIPKFDPGQLSNLAQKSYHELATLILSRFLTDYPLADLQTMVQAAYSYPEKFDDPLITPVCQLNPQCYLLELWHGPTCAFKDIALQLLPHLMTKSSLLANETKEIVILVATSGDTGKAALEGFKNVPGTRIVVFFPNQGVSEIQRLQMVTQEGENTRVVSVQGNFDDAQSGVKQIFANSGLAQKLAGRNMAFSSANSINWGRLAPQIVYYFDGYFRLCRKQVIQVGDKINIAVPTGNFGNILAAYLAKQMGLPVNKLICASNSNNVLTDFVNSGSYDRNRKFYTTISPSMDILISSNLERLLYYLSEGNCTLVKGWMNQLKNTGGYQVDSSIAAKITADFYAGFATEDQTMAEIKRIYQETHLIIDPHTAVATAVYQQYQRVTGDSTPVLVASTASPFKFNTSVLQAIGETGLEGKSEFQLLERLEKLAGLKIPKSLAELSHKPVRHKELCRKEEMAAVVEQILGL